MRKSKLIIQYMFLMLLCIVYSKSDAQRNTMSAGGDAIGSGGSISFSVGQIDFQYASGSGGNITLGVQQTYKLSLNLKAYIEGYYLGGGYMQPVLLNQGVLGATSNQCDSILIELHNSTWPYALIESKVTLLNTNGTISADFTNTGSFYVVLKHRNGIQTWSKFPILIDGSSYDFTTDASKAFGDNQILIAPGIYALYSGDLNQDENMDLLDMSLLETEINNFGFGYLAPDINGDGNVDLLDSPIAETNINGFIYSIHP